jgi:hypothetical protein
VFQHVGAERIWDFKDLEKVNILRRMKKAKEYVAHNEQVSKDYNGFVFFCATDQFISIAFSQVL